MAEVKDKVVTVESLNAVHNYNQKVYMTKENPVGNGDFNLSGDFYSNGTKLVKSTDVIPMDKGGTGANNGADGLKNLFAAGATILSSEQFGDELPTAGNAGRVFFKRLVE